MQIAEFRLENYKSYYRPQELRLAPGFNLITGQNNVGKTALIEALSFTPEGNPHESLESRPTPKTALNPASVFSGSIILSNQELKEILFVPGRDFIVPLPVPNAGIPGTEVDHYPNADGVVDKIVEWILSRDSYEIHFRRVAHGSSVSYEFPKYPSYGLYEVQKTDNRTWRARFRVEGDRSLTLLHIQNHDVSDDDFGRVVLPEALQRIYQFRAERSSGGRCAVGDSDKLNPNAQNLAEVLNNLDANRLLFDEFNTRVTQILPQVRQVSVVTRPNQQVEVLVWTVDPKTKRLDLAKPLRECGTGIGQVLAILYVVMNSPYPQTILIDEPQSFLHPGAIRKLVAVLRQHPEHQYILATHSPAVISSSSPSTITLVRQEEGQSKLQPINPEETKEMGQILTEVGARLSDVYGADNVLWVEGATEEICFPEIIEKVAGVSLMGTVILGVQHTGDFEAKHSELIFDLYQKLSTARALLPSAVGFVFDAEGRPKSKREDLVRKSGGKVSFLPRRMFENYLLDAEAIAAVANSVEGFRETPLSVEEVEKWLELKKKDAKYGKPSDELGQNWQEYVHGASLLHDLFAELSETRVMFDKVTYSVALSRWIIENKPHLFEDLASLLSTKLGN